jgi:hypothetical protein
MDNTLNVFWSLVAEVLVDIAKMAGLETNTRENLV